MLSVHWHFREKTRLIKQQFIKTKNFILFYKSKTVFLTHSNTQLQHSLLFFLKINKLVIVLCVIYDKNNLKLSQSIFHETTCNNKK